MLGWGRDPAFEYGVVKVEAAEGPVIVDFAHFVVAEVTGAESVGDHRPLSSSVIAAAAAAVVVVVAAVTEPVGVVGLVVVAPAVAADVAVVAAAVAAAPFEVRQVASGKRP